MTNFEIGRRIVEHEQKGKRRAAYGKGLLKKLSERLTGEFGRGFSEDNLSNMRRFFLLWEPRVSQFPNKRFGNSGRPFALSWTHYQVLLSVKDPDERSFYEVEAAGEGWSVPELKRQKASALYERLALILITITGANVTKAARVEEQIPEAYVSQHIALTRPRWSEMSKWLHLCFISHGSARGALEQLAYGDKPGLNLNNIRDLVLPVPPLAEQRRIVAKVDELMALVDELEARLAATRATATNLLSAVVSELTGPRQP